MDQSSHNKKKKLLLRNNVRDRMTNPPTRPTCTRCGRELIQSHITAGDKTFTVWLCDCVPQPEGIPADIVRSREWDDEVLFYTIEYHSGDPDAD